MKKIFISFFMFFVTITFVTFAQNFKSYQDVINFKNAIRNQSAFSTLSGKVLKNLPAEQNFGQTPPLNWITEFGGSEKDAAQAVVIDNAGNAYFCGYFSGNITINDSNYVSNGANDGFIAKIDNSGNILWFKTMQAEQYQKIIPKSIALDSNNNVAITGYYKGTANINGITLNNKADNNSFFAKYTNNGNFVTAVQLTNDSIEETAHKIESDGDNFYILTYKGEDKASSRILKIDTTNQIVWSKLSDKNFYDLSYYNDSIYISGYAESDDSLALDTNVSLNTFPWKASFFVNADLSGKFHWVKQTKHESFGQGERCSIKVNENGIYISGIYRKNVIWDTDTLSTSYDGYYLAKFDLAGNCLWLTSLKELNSYYVLYPAIFAVNNNNETFAYIDNKLKKIDTAGNILWDNKLDFSPLNLSNIENNTNIFVGKHKSFFITKLDSLNQVWNYEPENDYAQTTIVSIVKGEDNTAYMLGYSNDSTTYQDIPIGAGAFICKLNYNGNIIWLKQFKNLSLNISIDARYLAFDAMNSCLYFTTQQTQPIELPNGDSISYNNKKVSLIFKLSSSGDIIWTKIENFTSYDLAISTDKSGNIIFSGVALDTLSINNKILCIADYSGFIVKYNTQGDTLWTKYFKNLSYDINYNIITAINSNNDIFFTGEFDSDSYLFDNDTLTLNDGDGNILFGKLDENGNVIFLKKLAGCPITWGDWNSWPTGITIDKDDYVFLKGNHGDSTYFDGQLLTTPFYYGKFVAKFDNTGNLLWINSAAEKKFGYDFCDFGTDAQGNVYTSIWEQDSLFFDSTFTLAPEANALVLYKYSANGELSFVKSLKTTGLITPHTVLVCDSSNIFLTASYNYSLEIDSLSFYSTTYHGFIVNFGTYQDTWIDEYSNDNSLNLNVYPNPAREQLFVSCDNDIDKINIINANGQVVKNFAGYGNSAEINISSLPSGIYVVQIYSNNTVLTKKIIIQ